MQIIWESSDVERTINVGKQILETRFILVQFDKDRYLLINFKYGSIVFDGTTQKMADYLSKNYYLPESYIKRDNE